MPLQFYNTLTRKKEKFSPINQGEVRVYTCGPTVYDYAHIGNLRAYVFADILERTLKYAGYEVKRVMNITDIGHLSSDADSGEDKMTKGLLREGKELTLPNMRELAEFYAEKFKDDLRALNVEIPKNIYYASDYVKEDVELGKKLESCGEPPETAKNQSPESPKIRRKKIQRTLRFGNSTPNWDSSRPGGVDFRAGI